jgi:hypothetical protein
MFGFVFVSDAGVLKAVGNVNTILSPALAGANPQDLRACDDLLWFVIVVVSVLCHSLSVLIMLLSSACLHCSSFLVVCSQSPFLELPPIPPPFLHSKADGTELKSVVGGNAITAASFALAEAGAKLGQKELFEHFAQAFFGDAVRCFFSCWRHFCIGRFWLLSRHFLYRQIFGGDLL